jgi:ribonuclease E
MAQATQVTPEEAQRTVEAASLPLETVVAGSDQPLPAAPVASALHATPTSLTEAPAQVPVPAAPVTAHALPRENMPTLAPVSAEDADLLPTPLPVQDLQAVVQAAGLQWVQSDPARVVQAERAMRKLPVPSRAPRERKPKTLQDEGPLLLVETQTKLPTLHIPENEPGHYAENGK